MIMSKTCKMKTIDFFKDLGFDMDITCKTQDWDEQVANAAAFVLYNYNLLKIELKTLEERLSRVALTGCPSCRDELSDLF